MIVSFGTVSSLRPLFAAFSLLLFLIVTLRQFIEIHVTPKPALTAIPILGEVLDDPGGGGGGQHRAMPTNPPTATVTAVKYVSDVEVPLPPAIDLDAEDGFPRGVSGFQPDGLSKHLVMPKMEKDDIGWIHKMPAWLNMTTKVYVPDAADGREHDFLTVPVNKGNEAMVYFTYIIEHYYSLPDIVVFTHSHKGAWHNNDLHSSLTPLMLRELNYGRVQSKGYMSLRCHWLPGCPTWIYPGNTTLTVEKQEESVFGESFLQLFGYQSLIPIAFGGACCAQFAVSRARILENSRDEYRAWRQWLVDTPLPDTISGRVLEYMWQYMFSPRDDRRPVVCPEQHVCYCDGYGICFGGQDAFERHMALRGEVDEMKQRMRLAHEEGLREGEDPQEREKGIMDWVERIAQKSRVLDRQLQEARIRGLDRSNRLLEVGEDEFSG